MKKFLLCMMLAGLMMPVVAQEKMSLEQVKKMRTLHVAELADLGISTQPMLPINPKGTAVEVEGWKIAGMSASYDRQSQGSVYPQTQIHDDGFIGVTWTNDDNPIFDGSPTPNRGVGYTYSEDGGVTWAAADTRAGGIPLYWPSYAQWGAKGEVILARSANSYMYGDIQILNGLVLLTREKKGEGEWTINHVPYPEGLAPDDYVMAWARMTTSGDQHQYIHIMTPIRTPAQDHPTYYYRTQDGGATWDVEGKIISEVVGHEWDEDMDGYSDGINLASQGSTVAACFMSMGSHGYVLKTEDDGDTWKSIKFFDSPVRRALTPADYADTVYAPVQGCIALDYNGDMHVAFSVVLVLNSETTVGYFSGLTCSFLSYWNENMDPIDGAVDYLLDNIEPFVWDEYFDLDESEEGLFYVNSTIPKLPVIGYCTPINDPNIFAIDRDIVREWVGGSYWYAGGFSFPQMAFDINNKLHLTYLGLLDGGAEDTRWLRHPFYITTSDEGATWTQTEYIVNNVDLIDREFAFLTLAGTFNHRMHLIAQIDPYAGTFLEGDHVATNNYYHYFYIKDVPTPEVGIDEVNYTPLAMNVIPNPASGQATVNFEGRGNVTVYNMLGQAVYHVENVENTKIIPLNNMATGVYFITVRSGNATATQKLIVQ